jgi:hypothetical protein
VRNRRNEAYGLFHVEEAVRRIRRIGEDIAEHMRADVRDCFRRRAFGRAIL